jgi:hypothetical protein
VEITTSDRAVSCFLRRCKEGIRVKVKVIPEIEDFFKQWGGEIQQAPAYGRSWLPIPGNDAPLRLWNFEQRLEDRSDYSLIHSGLPLVVERDAVNVSFLRLVGASEGEGREFIIQSVMGRSELERIASRIVRAGEHFYINYIQPVNLHAYVAVVDITRSGGL